MGERKGGASPKVGARSGAGRKPTSRPTVKHCETELQDPPDGVDNSMEGDAVMGKMLRGIDPALFERLADGA